MKEIKVMKTIREYIDIINEMNADGTPDGFQLMPKDEYDALPQVEPQPYYESHMQPILISLQYAVH